MNNEITVKIDGKETTVTSKDGNIVTKEGKVVTKDEVINVDGNDPNVTFKDGKVVINDDNNFFLCGGNTTVLNPSAGQENELKEKLNE